MRDEEKTKEELRNELEELRHKNTALEISNKELKEEIIELKQAEEALVANEQRIRTIINNAEEVIYTLSWTGDFIFVSPAWTHIVGHPVSEIVGRNFVPFVHPDDVEGCFNFLTLVYTTGLPQRGVEYRVKTTKGEWVWFTSTGAAIKDTSGAPIYYVGVALDITERKKSEDKLRTFKESVESSSDAIGMSTPEGKHYYQNRAFKDLFGELGENDSVTLYVNENIGKEVFKTIMAGDQWAGEVEMYSKDGTILNILLRAYASKNIDGQITSLVGIHTDITERKIAEKEHEKMQGQLLQMQKMEAVGRLAGGVAHDFNNMLVVIFCHVEMALEEVNQNNTIYNDLKEIQKAAQRSAKLTRQLLAFARKQTASPIIINLNETIEEMLKMLSSLIGEDIDLMWKPFPDLWLVKMDPSQIDQILANLCVNARDSIYDVGKITIETGNVTFDEVYCSAQPGFIPGIYVMLAVSDNGCGMEKEVIEKIFEPFFTTKEMGKGTGLGLATVYGIVRQNNGFINVYSEPKSGTTFKIYLPRFFGNTMETAYTGLAEVRESGGETLLLVEDEPAILNITKAMLETLGYQVLAANTPVQAVRIAEEFQGEIHLLITDVVMPEMNGRELAKRLNSLYSNISNLFMSGYTADVIAHHGVLNEGVNFIQKPFSKNDLAYKVRMALES
jgi:PAS domain S-box-containing protein